MSVILKKVIDSAPWKAIENVRFRAGPEFKSQSPRVATHGRRSYLSVNG